VHQLGSPAKRTLPGMGIAYRTLEASAVGKSRSLTIQADHQARCFPRGAKCSKTIGAITTKLLFVK
jgi:hypothetical protein